MRIAFNNDINRVTDFVRICSAFQDEVDVKAGHYVIDGKSLLGMISICTRPDLDAKLLTTNPEAQEDFRDAIRDFIVGE